MIEIKEARKCTAVGLMEIQYMVDWNAIGMFDKSMVIRNTRGMKIRNTRGMKIRNTRGLID